MIFKWLPKELTDELHALTQSRAEKVSTLDHYAFMAGYYQSLIDTFPDTAENREHIQNTIKRLKENDR